MDNFTLAFRIHDQSTQAPPTNAARIHAFAPALDPQAALGVVSVNHHLWFGVLLVVLL